MKNIFRLFQKKKGKLFVLTCSFVVPWFKEQRVSKCVKETISGLQLVLWRLPLFCGDSQWVMSVMYKIVTEILI